MTTKEEEKLNHFVALSATGLMFVACLMLIPNKIVAILLGIIPYLIYEANRG